MDTKNNNGGDLNSFIDIILAFMLTVTIAKSSFYPFTEFCHGSIAEGNTSGSHNCTMTIETQMYRLLLSELVSALKADDSDTFGRCLSGGIQDLGQPAVEELMLEWMNTL